LKADRSHRAIDRRNFFDCAFNNARVAGASVGPGRRRDGWGTLRIAIERTPFGIALKFVNDPVRNRLIGSEAV
jgi:hypothetical protein